MRAKFLVSQVLSDVATVLSPGFFPFAMLLHDGARRDLLGALAVAAGASGGLFDVFVLPLFFRTGTAYVTFNCHICYLSKPALRMFISHAGAAAAGKNPRHKPSYLLIQLPAREGGREPAKFRI